MCHSKNNIVIIFSICLTFFQNIPPVFGCVILFLLNCSINRSRLAHCGVGYELIHSSNRRWHEWSKQQCRTFRRVRLVIGSPQGHLSAETKTWFACIESRLSWDKMHTFTPRRFKVNQATLKQRSLASLHFSMCLKHSDKTVFFFLLLFLLWGFVVHHDYRANPSNVQACKCLKVDL